MNRGIVWFRDDLRVDDHEPLAMAARECDAVLCVYVLAESFFAQDSLGFPGVGPYRRRFLAESLLALDTDLRERGQRLIVQRGNAARVLKDLAQAHHGTQVFAYRMPGTEETSAETEVSQLLRVQWHWGKTLVHPDDLPFPIEKLPHIFTDFRKQIEKNLQVREPIPTPPLPPPVFEPGPMEVTGLVQVPPAFPDSRAVLLFTGGALPGLARLQHYLWDTDAVASYYDTRNGLLGSDYSAKLSPWLANGCVSPRQIYKELRRYEADRTKNQSTYWLLFELLWRDFFQFVLLRYGAKMFRVGGLLNKPEKWESDAARFGRWREGTTGLPFVDANLRELAATGWMSNRGRQNVAAFLAKSMRQNWTWGARWFESQLIDYDVGSNWGNWNYTAGVGNDPRPNRWFDTVTQGQRYDPSGDYVRTWVPELAGLRGGAVHAPFQLSAADRTRLAGDYPLPDAAARK